MPCYARVTNLANGKSLIVRVNDRGPYHGNRLIDVSNKAAELLEFKGNGVARVRVEYVGPAPLEGSDDRQLMATLRTGVPAPAPSLVRVASARPFVPDSARPAVRSVARCPMPEGRPYNLGSTRLEQAAYGEPRERTASTRSRSNDQFQDEQRARSPYEQRSSADASPVSAYAPIDPQIPSELLAGRGLY